MHIFIDADACPVKDVIIEEAQHHHIQVKLVKSYAHFSYDQDQDSVQTIYVDPGSDAADYRIMQLARAQDLIITQDYGLAALGLAKRCHVMHHMGWMYTQKNMDQLLDSRHAHSKLRRGGYKTKGPKPFTEEDRQTFRRFLRSFLSASV